MVCLFSKVSVSAHQSSDSSFVTLKVLSGDFIRFEIETSVVLGGSSLNWPLRHQGWSEN